MNNKFCAWFLKSSLMVMGGVFAASKTMLAQAKNAANIQRDRIIAQAGVKPPVLLGLYTENYLGEQAVIDKELKKIDQWAGKGVSVAGFFMDMEDSNPAYNVGRRLELLRTNGVTAFINLESSKRSAAEISRGDADNGLQKWAKAYADWAKKGERVAYISIMQEMNISGGESFENHPENYKQAYQRIQIIFNQAGVPANSVRWVFAPNGWSEPAHKFENYYPTNARVDVVAFSAYNWGFCPNAAWKNWDTPQQAYEPYIQRMQKMAPGKPIFIAQTASSSYTQSGQNSNAKNQWFRDSYNYLAAAPGVQGIIYFNINKECDWALYTQNGNQSDGYKEAIANPAFSYVPPTDLAKMQLK